MSNAVIYEVVVVWGLRSYEKLLLRLGFPWCINTVFPKNGVVSRSKTFIYVKGREETSSTLIPLTFDSFPCLVRIT